MTVEDIREKLTPILQQYDVEYAGIFGSVARGEARQDSDVDVLVKFKNRTGLFKYMHLENEIKDTLRTDVDLVTEGGLDKYLRPSVMQDLRIIYGQR